MICYSPFWETLKKSLESTYTLINNYHISSSTIDKLRTCLKSKKACLKTKYTQKISENKIILKRNDFIFFDILIVFRQALRKIKQ